MTTEFASVPSTYTVQQTLDYFRHVESSRETVSAIYVLDPLSKKLVKTPAPADRGRSVRGLTFRMAQTPVRHYLPQLLERVEKGEIDPSFVVTHRATLEKGPELYKNLPRQEGRLHQGSHEAVAAFEPLVDAEDGLLAECVRRENLWVAF